MARRLARALVLPVTVRGRVVLTLDPDLVPAAVARRWLGRGASVVDVHEDYLALLRDRPWAHGAVGTGARAVAAAGNVLAGYADLTVVADDHVPPEGARHRLVVRNLPDLGHLPKPSAREPAPRAVYIGDVRSSRGLRTMLEGLEGAPAWTLDVVGPLAPADAAWLEAWYGRSTSAGRVRFHGRLAPEAAWAYATGAWAGLMLLDDTPAFARAVPSKLYEYLACGLAVVTTPLPRASEVVVTSGAGVVARDAAELSATLNRWSDDPDAVDRLREAARVWAEQQMSGPSPYDELAAEVARLVGQSERE